MSNMTIPGLSFDASNESPFDSIRQVDATGEFWMGRQLMPLLEYVKWERFEDAIERAMVSCSVLGMDAADHFVASRSENDSSYSHIPKAGNMVNRPQGGGVQPLDYKMSRYGCYLTAMNGDPRKPAIAAAQAYFVAKTRQAETTTAPQPIAPPTDPFWQLIDGAIARNMQPEQVISLKRLYDGTPAPTPAAPKAAKVKPEPPPVDAQTIVDRFRADLQTGLDIGLFNDSNVRQITKATGQAFLAVHMPQVWPTYQAHFNPTFDKQELNEAAKACGGEVSSTQKFQQGKTTITRKCLLIPAQ